MYLGIDIGTGSLKAAIIDSSGGVVASAEERYGTQGFAAEIAEFDPLVWWEAGRRVVRKATASVGRPVDAVAVAGQMHGVVLLDAGGSPVRKAVLWPDHRADSILDVFAAFHANSPATFGNPVVPGMAGPILVWLARNQPDALARAAHVVQPKDWLRMQLCRNHAATDPTDASGTLLYDVTADDWSDAVCAAVGVRRDLLPPIRSSSSVAGTVDASVARDLNLRPGTPVATGAGDAAAALLGAGIEEPGAMLVNTGTGAQVATPIPAPTIADAPSLGLQQFRSASDVADWYAMAAVVNGGLALGWARRLVDYDWEQVYATAEAVLATPHSDDPVFLPFLSHEREPAHGDSGATWTGLRLGHDRDALIRAAVRGVASYIGLRTRTLMERTDVKSITVAGGASRNPSWVELIATILGYEVTVAPDPHLTVRGAAALAARAIGQRLRIAPSGSSVQPRADCEIEGALREFQAAAAVAAERAPRSP